MNPRFASLASVALERRTYSDRYASRVGDRRLKFPALRLNARPVSAHGSIHRVRQHAQMAEARKLVGDTVVLGVHVARSLYGRWRRMSGAARQALEPLAEDVKERALDLRGRADPREAQQGLREANERLVDAMVETAAADPDVSEVEVRELRDDLARELERLAGADIKAFDVRELRQDSR